MSAAVPSLSGSILSPWARQSLVHEAEGKIAEGPALPLCTSGQLHRWERCWVEDAEIRGNAVIPGISEHLLCAQALVRVSAPWGYP